MKKATKILVGPGGRKFKTDPVSWERALNGELRRVPVYNRDRHNTKGRPDFKIRAKNLAEDRQEREYDQWS